MLMVRPEHHQSGRGVSALVSGTEVPLIHEYKPRAVSSLRTGAATAPPLER